MKEHEKINHRGHREINRFSLCSPKDYPLKDVTREIISCCINVHSSLDPGLLENIYKAGILIDFNVLRLKEGIKRLINLMRAQRILL